MDIDLSQVRLHTGPIANSLADQAGALAFAHGNHIVLGARAERLSGSSYQRVLHHELIHVVQQSAPPLPQPSRYQRPETRGPPARTRVPQEQTVIRPKIRAPPQMQCWIVTDAIGSAASAVGGAVYDGGAFVVGGAIDLGKGAVKLAGKGLKWAVNQVAPGLWDLLNGGIMKKLGKWLCQGIDFVLGKLFGSIANIDIMTSMEKTFKGLAKKVSALGSTVYESLSDAASTVLSPILDALDAFKPIIDTIKGMVKGIKGVFSKVWNTIAVSAWKILETVGGAIWSGIKWVTSKVWSGIKAVKNAASWIWDELSDLLGIDWSGEGGVTDSLKSWASEVYDELKGEYETIKKPLLTAVAVLVAFSPLGPLVGLAVIIPPLYEKIKWLIDNWDKAEVVVKARETLNKDIIPALQKTMTGVRVVAAGAAAWFGSFLGSIAGFMAKVVSAFGTGGCAPSVDKVLAHIVDQLKRFETWANDGFAGLRDAMNSVFDAISAFFQKIKKFLAILIQGILAPFTLPAVFLGLIWLALPNKFKPPIINFVLDLLIGAVKMVPSFMPGLFPLVAVFKAGLLGFLRGLRGDDKDDQRKIDASNKVADLMTGSLPFIAGMTVGILKGLIEGIIDPFKLLFMLFDLIMKGVAVIGRAITALVTYLSPTAGAAIGDVNRAISGPPPPKTAAMGKAPAPAAAPAQTLAAAPATATISTRAPPAQVAANRNQAPAQAPTADGTVTSNLTRGLSSSTAAPAPVGRVVSHLSRGPPGAARSTGATTGPPGAAPAAGTVTAQITRGPPAPAAAPTPAKPANANAAPAANANAAPGAGGGRTVTATTTDPAPAGAGTLTEVGGDDGPALVADVSDQQIIANMSPAVINEARGTIAGEQEFTPESLENGMRAEVTSEGSTIAGLAKLLGDAWNWLMEGAGKVGRMAAGWFMKFIELPNYKMGSKLGWLTGMILLELLINYFTAGGYMVIKQGATWGTKLLAYFVRYLDMGGAILGVMGKGLGKLRGPIMGGLDAASGFLSRFNFLQAIMSKVRGGADWLFRFGDEIGAAADLARKGPLDGAAGRGATGLGDNAAGGIADGRKALDGPAPPSRAPDAPPARAPDAPPARAADPLPARTPDAPPARTPDAPQAKTPDAPSRTPDKGKPAKLDEAADGTRRTVDDPANPRVHDDTLAAAEKPQAIALAKGIAESNDLTNQPIPIVMGALLTLKARFRWIDYFIAHPKSGRRVFKIGMVASPETEIDGHYSVYESPAPRPPLAADPKGWRKPPEGSKLIEEGDHYVVYLTPDGKKRIRFDTQQARTSQAANPGRNMTAETGAGVSPDGRPFVFEGRHRSAGAAQGDHIPKGAGGIDGHPGKLDFEYRGRTHHSSGPDVKNLKIDKAPEMGPNTLKDYDKASDLRFFDKDAHKLTGIDRDLMNPKRGKEIANDIAGGSAGKSPAQVSKQGDDTVRAVTDGHPPRSNLAAKNGQLSAAMAAAHTIVALNDPPNTPLPLILGQLLALKAHYKWIDTFEAKSLGGARFQFFLIASKVSVGTADLDDAVPKLPGLRPLQAAPAPVQVAPGVLKRPRGSAPRRTRQPDAPPPRDPLPDAAPAHTPGKGFKRDEVLDDFNATTRGNGGMTPTGASQNNRIPDFPRRKERHTKKVMDLENNRVFGGTNESFLTHFLDNGSGQAAQRFQRVAEQVHIRPIGNPNATGKGRYGPKVIADNVVIDTHTGAFHILDAKTSARAPLTANQTPGYPNIAANGGRIESKGLPGGLGHHTEIPPTPVSRAEPNVNLKDPNAPVPPGGLDYKLTPIPPARPVSNIVAPVGAVTPPSSAAGRAAGAPHPAATRAVGQSADQAGTRMGKEIVDGPPIVSRPNATNTAPDGTVRATPEPDVPTVRNPAAKLAELPQALAAARAVTEAADAIDLPITLVIAQLMLLKRRYRWIDTFQAIPRGAPGRYEIDLIASKHKIDIIDVDSVHLFHGTSAENARKLAQAMRDRGKTFVSDPGQHDLGKGLYLFDLPEHARKYAGEGGTIIEIAIPLPKANEITDIALQGFGRNRGVPGAERDLFLTKGAVGAPTAEEGRRLKNMGQDLLFAYESERSLAKGFTTKQTAMPGSPFHRNLARGQLFDGTLPDGAQLARGGLGFEYDVIQWRMKHPTDAVRKQIIEQVLGLKWP